MKRSKMRAAGFVGIALLAGLPGCEGLQDPPVRTGLRPGTTAEEEPDPVPKDLQPRKAPLPALPPGAGPIDADAPQELTPTASGLYYRILRKSDGRKPVPDDFLAIHFQGTLEDGRQFDSSYDRKEPMLGKLSGHFRGWIEGLQLIGEGGMIELYVPYYLARGAAGKFPIVEQKSTLHFIVELKDVE